MRFDWFLELVHLIYFERALKFIMITTFIRNKPIKVSYIWGLIPSSITICRPWRDHHVTVMWPSIIHSRDPSAVRFWKVRSKLIISTSLVNFNGSIKLLTHQKVVKPRNRWLIVRSISPAARDRSLSTVIIFQIFKSRNGLASMVPTSFLYPGSGLGID